MRQIQYTTVYLADSGSLAIQGLSLSNTVFLADSGVYLADSGEFGHLGSDFVNPRDSLDCQIQHGI